MVPLVGEPAGMSVSVASTHPVQGGLPFATTGGNKPVLIETKITTPGWWYNRASRLIRLMRAGEPRASIRQTDSIRSLPGFQSLPALGIEAQGSFFMWPFKRGKKNQGEASTHREPKPIPVVDAINWDWEPAYYDRPGILQMPRPMVRKDRLVGVMVNPDQVIPWGDLSDIEVGRRAMEVLMGLFMLRSDECPKHFWCGEFRDLSMIVEAYLGVGLDGSVGSYIGVFFWQVLSFEEAETADFRTTDGAPLTGFDVVSTEKPWMKALLQPLAGGYARVSYGFAEQVAPGLSWNDQGLLIPETIEILKCGFRSLPSMAPWSVDTSPSTFMVVRHGSTAWSFGRCFKTNDPTKWIAAPPEVHLPVETIYGQW